MSEDQPTKDSFSLGLTQVYTELGATTENGFPTAVRVTVINIPKLPNLAESLSASIHEFVHEYIAKAVEAVGGKTTLIADSGEHNEVIH